MQLRRRTAEEPVTLAVCAWLASRPSSSRNFFLWESVSSNLTACDVGRADPSLRPQCGVQPADGQWRDFGWSNRKESSCHGLATPASEPWVFQGLLPGEGLPKGGREAEREVKRGRFQAALHQPWVCSGPAMHRCVSRSFQLHFVVETTRTQERVVTLGLRRASWGDWPGSLGMRSGRDR